MLATQEWIAERRISRVLAGGTSVTAVLMAVWPGIRELLGGPEAAFSPTTAILTATLLAAIWYTCFTYESLEHARSYQEQERKRARASLATALLAELQWLSFRLRNYFGSPADHNASIKHPIIEEVIRNATLFAPETIRRVTDVHRLLGELEQAIERRDASPNAEEPWVRPYAGSAYHQVVALVDHLQEEGGLMPRRLWPRQESEIEPLPPNPFEVEAGVPVEI